jgi:hypothetical protein
MSIAAKGRQLRTEAFKPIIEELHTFAVELAAATVSGDLYQAAARASKSKFFQPTPTCKGCGTTESGELERITAALWHLKSEATELLWSSGGGE